MPETGQRLWYDIAVKLHARVQRGEEADPQRRLLLGAALLLDRHPGRSLHAGDRGGAHRRLDGESPRAIRRQSPHPPARRLQGLPAPRASCRWTSASRGQEPHAEADRAAPRLGQARGGGGDRGRRRPGAPHRHQRRDGVAAVRGDGRAAGDALVRGELYRPQRLRRRLAQFRRPPLHGDGLEALRRVVLQARQRHLPPGALRVLQRAGPGRPRHRQPHAALRLDGHAGDRRGRPRRRRRHGRRAVLPGHAARRARHAHRAAPAVGVRQGRDPRAAPPLHRAGRQRQDLRVRRAGRRRALAAPARDDLQHGRGADAHDQRVPVGRGDARVLPAPRARGTTGGRSPPIPTPSTTRRSRSIWARSSPWSRCPARPTASCR